MIKFLALFLALGGIAATQKTARPNRSKQQNTSSITLPSYARMSDYRSLKQSSHQRNGGDGDSLKIEPDATQEIFNSRGPGVIAHIWITMAADDSSLVKEFVYSPHHLKEVVLRAYCVLKQKY